MSRLDALRSRPAATLFALLSTLAVAETVGAAEEWQPMGLMRVRDMTPFGISRLDILPAYPAHVTPYTFALEVTYAHQNTWALSQNVRDYLEQRGLERGEIGAAEIAAIQALPGEAYLVDGELGLLDLTAGLPHVVSDRLHLRFLQVHDRDVGPVAGQPKRDGTADPLTSAGDEGDFPVDAHVYLLDFLIPLSF